MILKKILMLSDTHFSRDNSLLFGEYDVEYSFNKLVPKIKKEKPDIIFITGDISQDGTIESYLTAKEYFSQIDCPKYFVMGNHDSNLIIHLQDENNSQLKYLDILNHRFIFISSYKGKGFDEGFIFNKEFDNIKSNYANSKYNYLITHHHFIQSNSVMDNAILENSSEFCNLINSYNFTAIFHGHVHNSYENILKNTRVFANPSTCVQFAISERLKLERIIGYRILTLSDNGYNTYVHSEEL